jgi:outer membrane receptor protein involved in Fe transport
LDASLGQLRGFFNVGDIQSRGVEANISYDWDKFGGFASGSQLLENRIANYNPALYGGSGGITGENDANFNKASVPRWNMAVGAYVDFLENFSVSGIYKIHEKIMVRGRTPDDPWVNGWDYGYMWQGGGQLDLVATAKNVGVKNLNLSIMGKNLQKTVYYTGSSMDPEHIEQINPQYYEVKVSYLW